MISFSSLKCVSKEIQLSSIMPPDAHFDRFSLNYLGVSPIVCTVGFEFNGNFPEFWLAEKNSNRKTLENLAI